MLLEVLWPQEDTGPRDTKDAGMDTEITGE